jgi:hypothetical protein
MPLALIALAACHDDGVSVNARPPLAGVRFINAVPDGGPVDIRYVDQVDWSGSSVNGNTNNVGLAFRAGTIHWATEAKARHIRVFPTDSSLAVTTQVLLDTTITIEPNKNITLMLVGSRAAGGKVSFIEIDDEPAAVPNDKVAVRLVNASAAGTATATADGYIVTDTTAAGLPASPVFAAVGPLSASPYVLRDPGLFAVRATAAGNTSTFWARTAPKGAPANGLVGVTAGYNGPGSALSAYLFPASVPNTGAPQSSAYQKPGVVFYVDFIPAPPQ